MTELELRRKFIDTAEEWLGYKESDGSHRRIVDVYNQIVPLPVGYKLKYTDAWCAATVSAAAWLSGLTTIIYPECSCSRMIDLYKKHNRWVEDDAYVPTIGDILLYGWSDSGIGDYTGNADHVGIIIEIVNGVMKVLEGNYKDAVGVRTIPVNAKFIRGYGIPDYASLAEPQDTPIVQLTDAEAYQIVAKAMRYMNQLPVPSGVQDEYNDAMRAGITDGSNPGSLATRWQVALMAYRASQKKG